MMPVIDAHARKQPEFEIFNMSYDEFHENIFNLLDNIEHGSARIETFVANLKDFTRLSYDVDEKWMDLNTVIESVVQMNREHILKKVKLFEKDVPENLPKIWSDPNAIEQILLNLIENAVQASNKENSKVALHVEVSGNWLSHVLLEVSDNGMGMDADTRNKIFDPFFTTKSHGKGMGLGLYVCSGLVINLGGRIEVESQPGEGSTFRVILSDRDRRSNKRF
jgi:polar amino acid transport system substrate-binding protein